LPLRSIARVTKLDSGANGRFLEIASRNFDCFVFAFMPSKHSRGLVTEFVRTQQALNKPFALQVNKKNVVKMQANCKCVFFLFLKAPPSLSPPVHEIAWLEQQLTQSLFVYCRFFSYNLKKILPHFWVFS
jgi:hypothetical protein